MAIDSCCLQVATIAIAFSSILFVVIPVLAIDVMVGSAIM